MIKNQNYDNDARVGTRSTLGPGAHVGSGAEVAPGPPSSARYGGGVLVRVPRRAGQRRPRALVEHPARTARLVDGGLRRGRGGHLRPAAAGRPGGGLPRPGPAAGATSLADAAGTALLVLPLAVVVALVVLAVLVVAAVRLVGLGLQPGHHPVHSRRAWQAWVDDPGARRGPHLAVPALLQHADPGLAARARAPGSAATSRPRRCC